MPKTIITIKSGPALYRLTKHPAETHVEVVLDFAATLLEGEAVANVVTDDVGTGVIAAAAADGQTVELTLTGGNNGEQIVTQVIVTGSQGNIRQATLLVIVRDPAAQVAPVVVASVQVLRDEAIAAQLAAELAQQLAGEAALATAADRIATGQDRIATGQDRIATGQDRVATGQDRIQTGEDAQATAADRLATGEDRVATGQDRLQTGEDAQATAADRVATGQDRVATSQDRLQTGEDAQATAADRLQTGEDAQATAADRLAGEAARDLAIAKALEANASADQAAGSAAQALAIYGDAAAQQTAVETARNQASLAAGYAAAAASVVQQDLSGVTAAALHRSPNAITALFVYDTSKDSDGGAWTERCQHTSWYVEPLCGKWLGAQASEAAARAVAGATTGDYFQRTSDGKFYSLNEGAGITEVFRGNKAKFPRLAAIVAEVNFVTIYDLTEPGRPMWMRFVGTTAAATSGFMLFIQGGYTVSGIAAVNGELCVVGNVIGGVNRINFLKDSGVVYYQYLLGTFKGGIARRNDSLGFQSGGLPAVSFNAVNAVAMTVLPDAPVDPVTGLKVPTIAVATNGGISVIQHSGVVRNSSSTQNYNSVALSSALLSGSRGDSVWYYANNPGGLGASFGLINPASVEWTAGSPGKFISPTRPEFVRLNSSGGAVVKRLRQDQTTFSRGIATVITDTHNTGHMVGDIRRCYLADVGAGSVSRINTFLAPFTSSPAGWSETEPGVFSCDGSNDYAGFQSGVSVGVPVGNVVEVSFEVFDYVSGQMRVKIYNNIETDYLAITGAGNYRFVLRSVDPTYKALLQSMPGSVGGRFVGKLRNVYIGAAVSNRSYKAAAANILGTLTKTAVVNAAQLVAYSGFSAPNYLREPYSADLDFGTGEWSMAAWVSIPADIAAVSTIACREAAAGPYLRLGTDAAGKLTATAYDGTTTRTVTTSSAYNTATWLKARATYRAGRLAITVNGVEVASTTGAPLLTLNNPDAVLTIGNSYALDAPFPGSIALLKLSATVPTAEQALWMYEQEKPMFREGAQVTLPDAGNILDLAYDDATDTWSALSAANESRWSGLVRTAVNPVPAGSFARIAAASGVKLAARTAADPGVDVTIPAYGLREELIRRAEAVARVNQDMVVFDFDTISFTAAMTSGSNVVTASSIVGTPYVGMKVTGTGIPADTTILGINGSSYTLSANCTATGSNAVAQADFSLPVGYGARMVYVGGSQKREGSTKDYTRLFDGFRENIRFGVSPGAASWVQIHAVKEAE